MAATTSNLAPTLTGLIKPAGPVLSDGSQRVEIVLDTIPMWSASVYYNAGLQVTGSDGKIYLAKSATKGVNPTTDSAVHWLNLW